MSLELPSNYNERIAEKFSKAFPHDLIEVYRDQPADREGRRGHRFSFVVDKDRPGLLEAFQSLANECREEDPEFSWNFFSGDGLDSDPWPRDRIWKRSITQESQEVHLPIQNFAHEAFNDAPNVVAVIAEPDIVPAGSRNARVTVVLRLPMGPPPVDTLMELESRRKELVKAYPEIVEVQAAPELNFPPTGINFESADDPWLELKGELMHRAESFKLIEAVWFAVDRWLGAERGKSPDERIRVWIYGDDSSSVISSLGDVDPRIRIEVVSEPTQVPSNAECIFNQITRLIKAEAEGDQDTVKRIRSRINTAAAQNPLRGDVDPEAPMDRNRPDTHFVPCRWCKMRIPASTNPQHSNECPQCGALQACMMIPTKQKEWPVLAIFLNPDGSAFVEVVGTPPGGRLDLAKTRRYTVPKEWAREFEQNPMGRKDPK